MARYAYGGKTTVESCRSIDVLHWNRLGYFRSPRWFSWAWTRDGERVASINVETQRHSVTLKYRSRSSCLCEPAGSGASTRAAEITKNPNAIGRQREHSGGVSRQTKRHALADL